MTGLVTIADFDPYTAKLNPRTYIRTFTGKIVRPLELTVEDIDIVDIAHALSNVCRFTGHVREFYSVAQHSIHCAHQAPVDKMLWALLHDASEAYIADIANPIKHTVVFDEYRKLEAKITRVIAERFNLVWPEPSIIKTIDRRMLATEIRDLLASDEPLPFDPYPGRIQPWPSGMAKLPFLSEFEIMSSYNGGIE